MGQRWGVYWETKSKQVIVRMTWEEARDLGNWLIEKEANDSLGKELVEAAKTGAGF